MLDWYSQRWSDTWNCWCRKCSTVSQQNCGYSRDLVVSSNVVDFVPSGGQAQENGPGGNVSVTATRTATRSSSSFVGATSDVDVIFGKVSGNASHSWSEDATITQGQTFSHDLAPGRYGTITPGFYDHVVYWDVQTTTIDCGVSSSAGGRLEYNVAGSQCHIEIPPRLVGNIFTSKTPMGAIALLLHQDHLFWTLPVTHRSR